MRKVQHVALGIYGKSIVELNNSLAEYAAGDFFISGVNETYVFLTYVKVIHEKPPEDQENENGP